jgi:uncharacterized protein (DUF58 family)
MSTWSTGADALRGSVRTALSSLTTRGRAFVSSGITASVCALALGLDDLARVGALLLVLPLVSALVVTRGRQRLAMTRTLSSTRVTVGQPARVEVSLRNEGRGPTGLLLLEDRVPYILGTRPRFVVDRMGPGWRRSVSYTARSDVRGHYTVGPMTVRVSDPFGLVELERTFRSTNALVVTPPVVPLPAIPLAGVWTGSGDNRPRDFAGGSAEDVTVREYRRGDDLRRVHWRSSAHAGELMVRREEQPWQSRATVFVDNRSHAHDGSGPASSLEHAVTVAASVAVHLARRGFQVRLATADSGHGWHEHASTTGETGALLEALALLRESPRPDIDVSWLGEAQQSGLLVAVLGRAAPLDRPVLGRMRHAASTPLAVVLDVERWSVAHRPTEEEIHPHPSAVALMKAAGWRAMSAGPDDLLASVWQQLGLLGRTGSSSGSSLAAAAGPVPVPEAGGAAWAP